MTYIVMYKNKQVETFNDIVLARKFLKRLRGWRRRGSIKYVFDEKEVK